ncbi:MAG: hypothetical protein JSV79_00100 [Armatimonadota bacterium]|nr:MAG: hypothetical protein JSV79_00100 [Armatimonadota bacterium]
MSYDQPVGSEAKTRSDEVDVLAGLQLLWRRRWLASIVVLCCVLLACAIGMRRAPKYVATAQFVASGSPPGFTMWDPVESLSIIGDVWGASRAQSNLTHAAAMRSPHILKTALEKLSPDNRRHFARYEDDVGKLPVEAKGHVNTQLFTVTVTSKSREASMALADAIGNAYVEYAERARERLIKDAGSSIEVEVASALLDLTAAEQALNARRRESGIYDAGAELQQALRRAGELRAQISSTRVSLAAVSQELAATRKLLDAAPLTVRTPERTGPRTAVEELEKSGADPVARGEQVAAPHSLAAAQEAREVNPTWLALDQKVGELTGKQAALKESIQVLAREAAVEQEWLRKLTEEEAEQARLSSMVGGARANYASLTRELSALRAGALARLPTVARLGPAMAPRRGSRGLRLLLATGFLVGLIIAVAVVFHVELAARRRAAANLSPESPGSAS